MKFITQLAIYILVTVLPLVSFAQARPTADQQYEQAKACYTRVKSDPKLQKQRTQWSQCIAIFDNIATSQAGTSTGAKAAYSSARLSRELHARKGKRADLDASLKSYNRVVIEYPDSPLADDALFQIALIRQHQMKQPDRAKNALNAIVKRYPKSDNAGAAKAMLRSMDKKPDEVTERETVVYEEVVATAQPTIEYGGDAVAYADEPASSKNPGLLLDVQHAEKGDDTIVTLSFDRPVGFKATYDERKHRSRSSSLEVLLKETYARMGLPSKVRVNSDTVSSIKVKPRVLGGTLVDVSLRKGADYAVKQDRRTLTFVFSKTRLAEPKAEAKRSGSRRVRNSEKSAPAAPPPVAAVGSTTEKESAWSKMMFWKKKGDKKGQLTIVIDPGHGGNEDGAVGPHGITEKDCGVGDRREIGRTARERSGGECHTDAHEGQDRIAQESLQEG